MSNITDVEAQHKRMVETPMTRLIVAMALPTTASQLVTVIYNTADTYFVSQMGTSATAAVGVVFSLMSIIQAFGFGLGMGASSIISRKLGARPEEDAHRIGSSAFAAAIAFGLAILVAGLCALEPFMRLLGSTETILPYACGYARYILIGAPIMCSSFVLNNILRSQGQATLAMWGLCAGGLLNIALDPLLIFAFNMGIEGAAVATVLSQCVSFAILLSVFLRDRSIVQLRPRYISHRPGDYLMILRMGLPTICRQGLASLASALMNIQGALFGDAAVAALTVSNKVYLLVRNIVIGVGQGFQPVAGYNYGARNTKRVREAFFVTCVIGTALCVVATGVLTLFAHEITGLFSKDAEMIPLCVKALYYFSAVTPLLAYSTYVNQLYQCLGFSGQASFLASCRQGIFYLPLIYLLPHFIGLDGVMLTQPLADLLTFIISIPYQVWFYRHILRLEPRPGIAGEHGKAGR